MISDFRISNMSKNLDGLSALNLSLDGRSIKSSGSNTSNNVNNNNNSANKKPPLTTNLGTNRTVLLFINFLK